MTNEAVKQALERRTESEEARTIYDLIERQKPAIERALPVAIGAERFARIVTTELRRNPELLACSPESVLGAMMLSAQLGLEPGPLGHAYLVPFKKQVVFIIGYKGYIQLAHRSDRLRDIVARTVYDGEPFEYEERDTGPRLRHTILPPNERGPERCWYARARLVNAGSQVQVLWPPEIEAHKTRSPAGRADKGPWVTDYDAMARKTCIRVMAPYLPLSVLATRGVERDEEPIADLELEPESED